MNGAHRRHADDVADQRQSLSSTAPASMDHSAPAAGTADPQGTGDPPGHAGDDSWRAEAARQWAADANDAPAPRKQTAGERLSSFRRLLVRHWHAAVAYCAVFWAFGMCVAFLGPTLLDLGCVTGSGMRAVSWVFVAQLLCSLIGASAASFLVKRYIRSSTRTHATTGASSPTRLGVCAF